MSIRKYDINSNNSKKNNSKKQKAKQKAEFPFVTETHSKSKN